MGESFYGNETLHMSGSLLHVDAQKIAAFDERPNWNIRE